MDATMTNEIDCPHDGCDVTRHAWVDMKNHIQSTHPRQHRVPGCPTCERAGTGMEPNHDASYKCESGWRAHCSCGTCF